LRDTFAETFLRECQALIPPAQIDLRVNTLKTTREAALAGLQASGIECWAGKYAPTAIRVKGRPAIMAHPLYKSGAIEIQDEGSQLVAYMLNPLPGQAVMDFCAGAGGKTLALGALMQNRGRVVAADVLASRLARAKDRFRRAGLQNVETRPLDEEAGKWLKRRAASFDRVLVDAPCSGVGTWRRNPDMRWRPLGPKLEELTALQADILARAAPLVKPGGRLAYATCSLLRAENEAIIEAFLTTHADFTLLPMDKIRAEVLPEMKGISGEYLRLTPSRHGTDGFFTAVLEKKIHVIPGDPATP
jgi:16S rRNA (cytosine967-C5)-methyltransferase